MIERIGKKITEVLSPIVSLNLSEAETEAYPYAVYDYEPIPQYTKDGIVGYSADVAISVISDQFDDADQIRQDMIDSLMPPQTDDDSQPDNLKEDGFNVRLQNWVSECIEGIWFIQILFNIKQTK